VTEGSDPASGGAAIGEASGALGTSLLFDVFALSQAVGRLLAETMRGGPLTPAEYAVYSAIFELEAATPTQLAARLGMRLTTFMDQLRQLETRGHARRLAHPTDRRSYRVVLSSEGLAAHRAANRLFERAYAAFATELGDEGDEADARAALDRVRAATLRARAVLASPRQTVGRAG
jgi:DNA-binding MarR family transcriptional regulator